jgi:hypothetical protein
MTPPSPADLEAALALIARIHADADVVRDGVADAYVVAHPEERLLYLDAHRRADLTEGDVYRTWVVTFRGSEPVKVDFFESRACKTGDETIPP